MPFPNHPGKHDADSIVTPERSAEAGAGTDRPDPPPAVVLTYSRRLMDYVTDAYAGRTVDGYYGDLYVLDGDAVGVLGNFGIGAPTTAMLMEELVRDGVETFLSVGMAGCLDHSIAMGEFVVPDGAIRDEGTSHHYLDSARDVTPSDSLLATVKTELQSRNDPFHVGRTWTTDAIFRETGTEVERYAAEGVLTVEMEASAVFAVADYRDVESAAMFVVSDYLGPEEWDPKFHLTTDHLHRLVDTATDLLATHGG